MPCRRKCRTGFGNILLYFGVLSGLFNQKPGLGPGWVKQQVFLRKKMKNRSAAGP